MGPRPTVDPLAIFVSSRLTKFKHDISRLPVSAPLCVYKGLFHLLGSFLTSFTFMPGPSEFSLRCCWGQGRVLASEAAAHWSGRLLLSGSQRHGFFSKGQALGRD